MRVRRAASCACLPQPRGDLVARTRPTLRRRESSALGRKVSSGEVPWAYERWARPRLRRVPANGRLPSGNVPPTLRRRHPPCTLTRSPSSARPPRGASVCNGTGSNYGAAIYPYRYRYRYTQAPRYLQAFLTHTVPAICVMGRETYHIDMAQISLALVALSSRIPERTPMPQPIAFAPILTCALTDSLW